MNLAVAYRHVYSVNVCLRHANESLLSVNETTSTNWL